MEVTLNGSRLQIALLLLVLVGCCSRSQAEQVKLPADAAKELKEWGSQYLPAGYTQVNVSLTDLRNVLKQRCAKANVGKPAGEVNVDQLTTNIEEAAMKMMQCVNGLFNVQTILDDVEDAKPKGDLDVVFEKYCQLLPNVTVCTKEFNAAFLPCLTSEERSYNAMMNRIVGKLAEFVCHKNGGQIALFIAEQGPECFDQQKDNIAKCIKKTYGHYLPTHLNVTQLEIPKLVVGTRECVEMQDFESCVVPHLENCENITPSNLVESLFRYIRKESNCQQVVNRVTRARNGELPKSHASTSTTWSLTALLISLALALRNIFN